MPAEYLPAFCRVTGCNEPIEILNETTGMFSMPGPDALQSEIHRFKGHDDRRSGGRTTNQSMLQANYTGYPMANWRGFIYHCTRMRKIQSLNQQAGIT